MYKRWTPKEDFILKLSYNIIPYKEMPIRRSEKAISFRAVKLGLSNKRCYSHIDVDIIKTNKHSESARLLGKTINAVKIKYSRCIK